MHNEFRNTPVCTTCPWRVDLQNAQSEAEKNVCVCERELVRFMWGLLSMDSPGLSHLCVGVFYFFFPLWDHWWSLWLKTKQNKPQAAEARFLGEGQDLIVEKLWEESHWSCCEGICELQGELPCWVAPCEGQCAVYSGTGPSGISYRPQPRCSQIELFVLCACAVFPHVLWAKAGKGRGAWPGLPCRHEWMKINKVHLRAEWIITTQAAA